VSIAPSLRQALRDAAAALADAGVPTPMVDAELLAAFALGQERGQEVSRGELQAAVVLGAPVPSGLAELVLARARRVPLQHLTGVAPFRGLELAVGPGVFVPRPETEQVAQHAIDEARSVGAARGHALVVDLCTGSGAIALAIAHEVPTATVHAVELDADAHRWAARNVARRPDRVVLVRGDARTALRTLDGQVDVVVSNPPYVPPGAVPVDQEVADHDPAVALYGLGPDGLEVPRGIIAAAARLLRPGGLLVMEHAEVQAVAAQEAVRSTDAFEQVETADDLTGRPRMVVARRSSGVANATTTQSDVEHSRT